LAKNRWWFDRFGSLEAGCINAPWEPTAVALRPRNDTSRVANLARRSFVRALLAVVQAATENL
jgi:hypothetical protein